MNAIIDRRSMYRLRDRWRSMLRRCEEPHHPDYRVYGGRGISVCREWHSFDVFVKWFLEEAKASTAVFDAYDRLKLSIDRIDNYGNYCPENCKLSTQKEQCNNMRKTRFIEFRGNVYSIREFCSATGVNFNTFYSAFIDGQPDINGKRIRMVDVDQDRLNAFLRKHAKGARYYDNYLRHNR